MKVDNQQPDPWMLEDVQLRCQLAADRWGKALALGEHIKTTLPASLQADFTKNLADLGGLHSRALAYVFHLRETNLATILRKAAKLKLPLPQKSVTELQATLAADLANHNAELLATATPETKTTPWKEMEQAIALLRQDPHEFLKTFFKEDPDKTSKGRFSATSR